MKNKWKGKKWSDTKMFRWTGQQELRETTCASIVCGEYYLFVQEIYRVRHFLAPQQDEGECSHHSQPYQDQLHSQPRYEWPQSVHSLQLYKNTMKSRFWPFWIEQKKLFLLLFKKSLIWLFVSGNSVKYQTADSLVQVISKGHSYNKIKLSLLTLI